MAGYQFMHVEAYGRSAGKGKTHTVRSIVNEANRVPGNFGDDIKDPKPPIHIYGKPLEELEATCDAWAEGTRDSIGRKARKDAVCLLAGVFSAPRHQTSPEEWEKLKNDAISFFVKKYGDRLQTVVEHVDEGHPHCHFYVVPRPGERFDSIHEGYRAVAGMPKDAPKRDKRRAMSEAMRGVQDEYFDNVGAPNGQARIGPGRRRLERGEWKAEQHAMESIGKKLQEIEILELSADLSIEQASRKRDLILKQANAEAKKALEDAKRKGFQYGVEKFSTLGFLDKINVFKRFQKKKAVKVEDLTAQLAEKSAALAKEKAEKLSWAEKAKKAVGLETKVEKLERETTSLQSLVGSLKNENKALKDRVVFAESEAYKAEFKLSSAEKQHQAEIERVTAIAVKKSKEAERLAAIVEKNGLKR